MVTFASAAGLAFGDGAAFDGLGAASVVFVGVDGLGADDVEGAALGAAADDEADGVGAPCAVVGDEPPPPHEARSSTLQVAARAPASSRVFMREHPFGLVTNGGSVSCSSSPGGGEIGQTGYDSHPSSEICVRLPA